MHRHHSIASSKLGQLEHHLVANHSTVDSKLDLRSIESNHNCNVDLQLQLTVNLLELLLFELLLAELGLQGLVVHLELQLAMSE